MGQCLSSLPIDMCRVYADVYLRACKGVSEVSSEISMFLGVLQLLSCSMLWCRVVTSKEYPVDSKVFFWSLGANPWGRYLRISENGAGSVPTLHGCAVLCLHVTA